MFTTRIKSLQNSLYKQKLDALLITSAYNIAYLTGIHAFSLEEREARILITKKSIHLFTDARYKEMVKEKSPFVSLVEVSSDNLFTKALAKVCNDQNLKQLGFEEDNIIYKEAVDLEETLIDIELIPVEGTVENLRMVKDNDEINEIKKACSLSDLGFEFILKHLKKGSTELEIKAKLDGFIRAKGGKLAFESIVAFGHNTAIPHHLSTNFKLTTKDIILLDFGAKVNGYCSDMTRTIFIGNPNEKIRKMYQATLEAQEIAIDYLKTHMNNNFQTKKTHILANNHLKKFGFPRIPHAIGHGVGLQVHEIPTISPFSKEALKPGMIITVEPGIYTPNTGGVRIEDTAIITSNGIELLTKSDKRMIIL